MTHLPVLSFDLNGCELTAEEREILQHPMIGGVVLFTRNYHSTEQLQHLIDTIRKSNSKELLISVDHEGGRVQRFRKGFTELPALARLGECYDENPKKAMLLAKAHGWLMATELLASGVDFSFAPVLDLNYGVSDVIGDRAFHQDSTVVTELAIPYIEAMKVAGMSATIKHFPGHGAIKADSHHAIPIDARSLEEITAQDMQPFMALVNAGAAAVMPAHVNYPLVDDNPAGFSTVWLQDILRQQLGFNGVIFSDDLTMEAASVAGSYSARAEAAVHAGCDMILACNDRAGIVDILDNAQLEVSSQSIERLQRMRGHYAYSGVNLQDIPQWKKAVQQLEVLM
ncbi:MAG: beta-N-acetylhexosaminidase [Thiotrichaceae bacterium]|nr:beta-N-acetylhexosaminidase [Thiotrichaceae bacterium]